jgi:hypothetical protein
MSNRRISVWVWVIGACLLVAAPAMLLPLLALPSNCGGNSAALSACRSVVLAFQTVALDRGDKPFRVADLNVSERENFRSPTGMSWLPGARLLVTSDQVSISHGQPRKIIAVCDKAYDNVPQRRFGRSPMSHAVAYSDGSVGLIPVADYQRSNLSRFVDVMTIAPSRVEPGGAVNRSQPVGSETNRASAAACPGG